MPGEAEYQELVKRAEAAVKSVTDPELRRVAFEKILDDLLAGQPAKDKPGPKGAKAKPGKAATPTKNTKKKGPQAYVEELVDEGFFRKQKTIAQVKAELENRGHHIPLTSLSGPLQKLCQRRVLRRQKTKASGKKQTYSYSEW